MKKIDLIIEALEFSNLAENKVYRDELIEAALVDLRELRDMKPVAYLSSSGAIVLSTTHPHIYIPLYTLGDADE